MKCPICKGNKYIQEFDSRGLRQYQCRKCGGTGEMNEMKYNNSDPTKPTFIESGEVDKIQEEFERYTEGICQDGAAIIDNGKPITVTEILNTLNSLDLLPTEKLCPECEGTGVTPIGNIEVLRYEVCETCKGKKVVPLYYSPEQYEKIMGKPYPLGGMVWYYVTDWQCKRYNQVKAYFPNTPQVIVQTAQPAPPADYRPEEI